jgi:hypothetical protein
VIAAPRTSTTKYGYVFDHCTIRNDMSKFAYARGWHTNPRCVWLNTTLETPEKLMATRFDPYGIRSVDNAFFEYNTMDASGRNITPTSNVVTFRVNEQQCDAETIITKKEAKRFCLKKVFPKWRPDKKTRKLEKQSARMKKKYLNTAL